MSAPVMFQRLDTESGHQIGIATLNSERSLNALSLAMVQSLSEQLAHWAADPQIVAVWLQGAGEKAFCAGGDIRAIYDSQRSHAGELDQQVTDFFTQEYQLDYQLHRYPKPLLVWGSGIVMGGGLGLMAGADFRLVTETSRIAMPEISIGLFPDVGGSYFLNRMPGHCGRFLGLTAYNMNGADACYVGLGDHLLASADKAAVLEVLTQLPWQQDKAADKQQLTERLLCFSERAAEAMPPSILAINQPLIDELMAGELTEVMTRLGHTHSDEQWLQRAINTAQAGSPITACLLWQQLALGREWSLEQVFQQELIWAVRCAQLGDFVEGVRALLIDKDRSPKWQFSGIEQVPAGFIEQLTESPWPQHPLQGLKESAL
ncbi:enoyl-CoA hydratase/isomerase family protein [Ferrimonas senticii]|uniref:enoyl-CoA hydratase/isomerase family protein n=1 Tax=Ferrimonas senticii TaxID=394566 RepID=UPI00048740A9|nr:enoyl-CoA hydratase/isomerase family protein [Ferrimonas senticii]